MNINAIIAFIAGTVLVLILAKIFFKSSSFILKLLFNSIVGGVALWIFNLIAGAMFDFTIGINIATAATVGVLGVPGFLLLIILKFIFG